MEDRGQSDPAGSGAGEASRYRAPVDVETNLTLTLRWTEGGFWAKEHPATYEARTSG